jgi:hypothetical protein
VHPKFDDELAEISEVRFITSKDFIRGFIIECAG